MAVHGVGIDVADVRRFARLLADHGGRFTERWFTDQEVRESSQAPDPSCAFALRFAAKEAVWKALGLARAVSPPWRRIAVLGSLDSPSIHLTGPIAADARVVGVTSVSVATCTSGHLAVAFAIAHEYGANGLARS